MLVYSSSATIGRVGCGVRNPSGLEPLRVAAAWVRAVRCESTKEIKGWSLLDSKTKACAVVGRREKSLLGNPGPEWRLGRETEKERFEDS